MTVKSSNNHGTVNNIPGSKVYNSSITVTATPTTNYKFLGWAVGGSIVSNQATYTFNMPAKDYQLTAMFVLSSIENGEIVPYNDEITFIVIKTKMSWKNAENFAISLGGHLIRIDSQDKLDLIYSHISSISDSWIGITDEAQEGTWRWVWGGDIAGTVTTNSSGIRQYHNWKYHNWNYQEPNDAGGEDYAEIYMASGKWNDLNGTSAMPFIVEIHNN